MSRRDALRRAEGQYLDLVDFIGQHVDQPLTPHDYLAWEQRDRSVDFGTTEATDLVGRLHDRFDQLTVAVTLPRRPKAPSSQRSSVWLAALTDLGGAFYHTGSQRSGTFVLDTAAHWSARGRYLTLVGNRWSHSPSAKLRAFMSPTLPPITPPREQEPAPTLVAVPSPAILDPTPEELMAAAASAAGTSRSSYTVEAAGLAVGDQLIVRAVTGDDEVLLVAQVNSVLPVVVARAQPR